MWELWGVEISAFPLTWHIAYTTACCYRTSRDMANTNTKANSAFHFYGIGRWIPSCLAGAGLGLYMAGRFHLCRVAGNTVWSYMAGDAPSPWDGFSMKSYTIYRLTI